MQRSREVKRALTRKAGCGSAGQVSIGKQGVLRFLVLYGMRMEAVQNLYVHLTESAGVKATRAEMS